MEIAAAWPALSDSALSIKHAHEHMLLCKVQELVGRHCGGSHVLCKLFAGGAQLEVVLEEMPKWALVQEVLQVPLSHLMLCCLLVGLIASVKPWHLVSRCILQVFASRNVHCVLCCAQFLLIA